MKTENVSNAAFGPAQDPGTNCVENDAMVIVVSCEEWNGDACYRRGRVRQSDFENRIIKVRTRVNRLGKGIGLLVREGLKTQPERRIVMPRLVADVLRKRWPRQLESRLIAGTQWKGPDYSEGQPIGFIFTGATGTVLQPRKADIYFASARTRAGLDSHRFHGLRHDFASLLLAAGVADRVVMEMMGHSTIAMTANGYQHVPDDLQRLAADRLDEMLGALSVRA